MKLIQKVKFFLKRDKDVTVYDEFHYIFITLKELVGVLRTSNK